MISWLMNRCFHEHSLFGDTLTDLSPVSGLRFCRSSELNQHRGFQCCNEIGVLLILVVAIISRSPNFHLGTVWFTGN
jgi:hypothetical protein